ncbi:MAG: 50S ribosomal protein L5 [Candidatus Sungbacteria bacterium]|nr:50S ribosomal protein L5 [Candidatus Sungbacteria bacterium]
MPIQSLQERYNKDIVPAMVKRFGYKNIMAVPRIQKVVLNCGVGKLRDEKQREEVIKFLTLIAGQKPSPRSAKKAIASFKTRKGLVIGYQVTLRGRRMYDFISRFTDIALPRTRDFRGIDAKSFDSGGNLTIGIKEHIVFPEMIGEDYHFLFGLEVTIVTTAPRREEGVELLKLMGFPIKQ